MVVVVWEAVVALKNGSSTVTVEFIVEVVRMRSVTVAVVYCVVELNTVVETDMLEVSKTVVVVF